MATLRGSTWSREQTLAALHLYLQLPFGQLHARQPKIKQLSAWIGRTPGSVALKLVNLASLDPLIRASGRHGMGNASALDKALWSQLQVDWDELSLEAARAYEAFAASNGTSPLEDVSDELQELPEGTTRSAHVQVRVNQARFRKAVLASYGAACCICGLAQPQLLIASHIVPWSLDRKNRLNPSNGLCLSALHDKAFDQGLITVMPDYTIRVHPDLLRQPRDRFLEDTLLAHQGRSIRMPEKFAPAPEFLLAHARTHGFIASRA